MLFVDGLFKDYSVHIGVNFCIRLLGSSLPLLKLLGFQASEPPPAFCHSVTTNKMTTEEMQQIPFKKNISAVYRITKMFFTPYLHI